MDVFAAGVEDTAVSGVNNGNLRYGTKSWSSQETAGDCATRTQSFKQGNVRSSSRQRERGALQGFPTKVLLSCTEKLCEQGTVVSRQLSMAPGRPDWL
jgi:hypothetical protein